jgi:protein tyrosine/serine phosphatase
MIKVLLRNSTLTVAAIMTFAIFAAAQTSPSNFPGVKIGNFGQMDENYFRGAQPLPDDYAALAQLGIKTIIDLRNDPTDYEKASAEAVGMKYINIPMSGWKKPKDADLAKFLEITNDPDTGKFFVHCKAGIHRTGVAGAVYRFHKNGWDYDKAYAEMKNYDFSSGLVHGALKSYVKNYAKRFAAQRPVTAEMQAAAEVN